MKFKDRLRIEFIGSFIAKQNIVPVFSITRMTYKKCVVFQRDPPDEDVPYCTLKSFPAVIEHCIQWARDKVGISI